MIPDHLIPNLTKLTCQQLEQVTCTGCCKYYIAPETATCGHTLCHGCWVGCHTCPRCASSVDRRALRFNKQMQELTEHIHTLCDTFETLFNVELADFSIMPDVIQSNYDPTRNVKDWLASSQNQFSGPALSIQLPNTQETHTTTQDVVQLSTSKIQIHTHTKIAECPPKVVCAPHYQEDWDKIEVLPDTEDMNAKQKENIVDPMDLDPFFFYENEYTTENPRRSSRKKDLKNESYPNPQIPDASADKHSSKNSSADADKKSIKVKQNWSSVKKMRKEFSKLNKNNRSKLNVSIEMCKKAHNAAKSKPETPRAAPQQAAYVIDDNTPDVENKEKEESENSPNTKANDKPASNVNVSKININSKFSNINEPLQLSNNSNSTFKALSKEKSNNDMIISQNDIEKECADYLKNLENISSCVNNKSLQADQPKINNNSNVISGKEIVKNNNNIPFTKKSAFNNGSNITNGKEIVRNNNTPFIKKGVLHQKNTEHHCLEIVQKEIETQTATNNSDIEISIKVGNSVTSIFIKEKQQEVQLKVNTDREIQTSLGPYNLPDKQTYNLPSKHDVSCSPLKEVNLINLQHNVDGNKVGNTTAVSKSVSTKKNTESADTATANFEITDSVERQISDVMDCIETNNAAIKQVQNIPQVSKTPNIAKSLQSKDIMVTDMNEIEDLNDIDIFESGSVKEANVQFIKNTKPAPSEILMSTMKNKTTQSIREKRDRDVNDEADDLPNNKKLKMDEDKTNPAVLLDVTQNENNMNTANDSESMSYDKIMGPIFENIDADIKSQNTVKNTQKTTDNFTIQSQSSQIIHKTQKNKSKQIRKDAPLVTSKTQEHINQKYSENIFSTTEKDCEDHSETAKDIIQHPASKSVLELSCNKNDEPDIIMDVVHILGTPIADNYDSDKSVVEETPQKNISFTKLKMKPDATNKINNTQKQQNEINPTAELRKQQSDSEIIKSIIDISDTSEENTKRKNTTVVEVVKKISNLETPLTINKFVNEIKHNSTPVARKSLNFETESEEDPEQTLCPTTTQEKEFLTKAFEKTPKSPIKKPLGLNKIKKLCIAGSCLTPTELVNVKLLCQKQGWTYMVQYSDDLTHLVVGVDEENKSQRSVKYMCAVAASKWIVNYKWVEKCLEMKDFVDELPYEALDNLGVPGPRRSRIAQRKLFEGFKFHCMPPFSMLDVETLTYMLEAAGGCVVGGPEGVRVGGEGEGEGGPALLLAETESSQDDKFMYLAVNLSVVPVDYEWALNCLGTHSLVSLYGHLPYPEALLPKDALLKWPPSLFPRYS